MLGWFKKKKTAGEDAIPVPDAISAEEGQTEIIETVSDISSGAASSQENIISEAAESETQVQNLLSFYICFRLLLLSAF